MSGIITENSGRHTGLVKAASGGGGAWTLILSTTISDGTDISFTSGIDSTYDEYVFRYYNINGAARFGFQANAVGASGYNETMQTTQFMTQHNHGGSYTILKYVTGYDQAQGTAQQNLASGGTDIATRSLAGYLHLYSPSNTTFAKRFIAACNDGESNDYTTAEYTAGYFNITAAIDEVQFKCASGNFSGTIALYGIS